MQSVMEREGNLANINKYDFILQSKEKFWGDFSRMKENIIKMWKKKQTSK